MTKTKIYLTVFAAVFGGVVYLNLIYPVDSDMKLNATMSHIATYLNIDKLVPTAVAGNRVKPVAFNAVKPIAKVPKNSVENAAQEPDDNHSGLINLATLAEESLSNTIQVTTEDMDLNVDLSEEPLKLDIAPSSTIDNADHKIRILLAPSRETTISSNIAARIIHLYGDLGQSFKAGQVLVSFECSEAIARVDIARAQLASSIEEHEAKIKMQGLDQASDLEVALAASTVNKSNAELRLNETESAKCKIHAPWGGRIAKAHVKNSMTTTQGQPLMEIVDSSALKIKLNVPSKYLSTLKVGKEFNVNIDETSQSYPARVTAINSRVDSVSQTVEVEAKMIKKHQELLAGMSGIADFSSL